MALTATKIKDSFFSLLPNKYNVTKRSCHTLSAPVLLGLIKDSGKSSILKRKIVNSITHTVTWKKCFVVLIDSALYVYDNETSKAARSCISLRGYNRVQRAESDKCAWGFSILPFDLANDPSQKRRTFHCSSSSDRKDWMAKVKESLFKANSVTPSAFSVMQSLDRTLRYDEDEGEYLLLEQPVFRVSGIELCDDDGNDDDDVFHSEEVVENEECNYGTSNGAGIWSNLHRQNAIKKKRRKAVTSTSVLNTM